MTPFMKVRYYKVDDRLFTIYLDRIYRIIGSIAFSVSGRNRENTIPAFKGGEKKPKRTIVTLQNAHVASLFCFYIQMTSLEEGYRFLPFKPPAINGSGGWKGKKILKIPYILSNLIITINPTHKFL
jgi:hypothetical protein